MNLLRLSLNLLRRDWRVRQALQQEATSLIGADFVISE
jgi:hypothetical protein